MSADARTAPVDITGLTIYPDGSGAPALVRCGPFVYAAHYFDGEVRLHLRAPVSGSRVQSKIAADRCERAYRAAVESAITPEWRELHRAMYAEELGR